MARKPNTDSSETRQLIVNTAFRLFGQYGFNGVSIKDIARSLNLTKGALYWHFRNKEALYLECLKKLRKLLRDHVYHPMEIEPHPAARIRLFFSGIAGIVRDIELADCIAGYFLEVGRYEMAGVRNFRRRALNESEGFLARTLEQGRTRGQFVFNGGQEELARGMFIVLEGCILQMRRRPAGENMKTIETLYRTFMLGLGGRQNLRIVDGLRRRLKSGDN